MKRRVKKQRGIIFLAVTFAMLGFGVLGLTMAAMVSTHLASAVDRVQSQQAFYVAEGGLHYTAMSQFATDTNFSDNVSPSDPPFGANSIALNPGEFWVEYLNQQTSSVDVRITARVGSAVRELTATLGQGNGPGGGGAGAGGTITVDGNLSLTNSTGTVNGDIILEGSQNIHSGVTVNGSIMQQEVIIPPIDFPIYQNLTTSTYVGNLTIDENFSGSLYVDGTVRIKRSVTVTGLIYATGNLDLDGGDTLVNGTLVSEGNVSLGNDVNIEINALESNPGEYLPAIVAGGNIHILTDNTVINGAIWAGGDASTSQFNNITNFTLNGALVVTGNASIANVTNLSLNFDATYAQAVPIQSGTGGGGGSGIELANWRVY